MEFSREHKYQLFSIETYTRPARMSCGWRRAYSALSAQIYRHYERFGIRSQAEIDKNYRWLYTQNFRLTWIFATNTNTVIKMAEMWLVDNIFSW